MKKYIIIALAIVVLLFYVVSVLSASKKNAETGSVPSTSPAYRKIFPEKAKTMMDEDPSAIVLDVRTTGEFAGGHIEGAVNIPVETIGSERPDGLPDLDATILVYCRSGNRSATAAKALVSMGYTQVYDFGGLNTWPYDIVK
jgi:rhodanese-related sulfurtransferase